MRKLTALVALALLLPGCPEPDTSKAQAEEAVAAAEKAVAEAKAAAAKAAAKPPEDLAAFFQEFKRVRVERASSRIWTMMAPAAQRDFLAAAEDLKQKAAAILAGDPKKNAKKLVPGLFLPAAEVAQMDAAQIYGSLALRQLTDEVVESYRDAKITRTEKAADGTSAALDFRTGDGQEFRLALVRGERGGWKVLEKSRLAKRPAVAPPPAAAPAAAPAGEGAPE